MRAQETPCPPELLVSITAVRTVPLHLLGIELAEALAWYLMRWTEGLRHTLV